MLDHNIPIEAPTQPPQDSIETTPHKMALRLSPGWCELSFLTKSGSTINVMVRSLPENDGACSAVTHAINNAVEMAMDSSMPTETDPRVLKAIRSVLPPTAILF